jgi:hypothetical protein
MEEEAAFLIGCSDTSLTFICFPDTSNCVVVVVVVVVVGGGGGVCGIFVFICFGYL